MVAVPQPARDRTSFFISPRSETGPVVYAYAYTMVEGKTPADMPGVLAETFTKTIAGARAVPARLVAAGSGCRSSAERPWHLPCRDDRVGDVRAPRSAI